jgi:hypothetical protein
MWGIDVSIIDTNRLSTLQLKGLVTGTVALDGRWWEVKKIITFISKGESSAEYK